jgi:hypothetical protein
LFKGLGRGLQCTHDERNILSDTSERIKLKNAAFKIALGRGFILDANVIVGRRFQCYTTL